MHRRPACVFETARTWHLRLDGQEHYVTARWEGILRHKLVVLVDDQIAGIYEHYCDVPEGGIWKLSDKWAGSRYFPKLRGVVKGPRSMDLPIEEQIMQDGGS
jgi:hypothetical protein